jgi:multidrug efflux pump subunit AcrA (membrane-fusion protein)
MVRVSQCSVLAPFDGHVAEKIANEFEIPVASAPLLRIVDDSRLEIEMIVPSSMLATLRIGVPFDFHVDETNSDHRATVTRLPAIVDSVSQTARVFGAFVENRPPEILPGMSGSASFAKSLSNAREGGEQ